MKRKRSSKPPIEHMTLEEACLKREELKRQGVAYPTIMQISGTDKYRVIECRAAKED